ncbi:hypothetical protein G7Z17_g928 [Cylindrodendrum hubeiense]|uniref:AttH domain-containing protein n=1 Tax=Cylindrodendrum hubeiense TaxID=595255 RepID=A0A9P5LFT4_9HYPO|nr:hypothetical protein G7Z17_g928 [Cylindrodendrum hubeiense]
MVGNFFKFAVLVDLVVTALGASTSQKYVFKPEKEVNFQNTHVPSLINLTDSQYAVPTGSSWWMSSFITSTLGKQYLAISHVMTTSKNICRSSVLDLQTLKYWVHLVYCPSVGTKAYDKSGPLDADFDTYGFGSTTEDSISNMYTYANTNASFSFNISWAATSKPVLNGGSGVIAFGPGPANATEWAIPAGKTTGNLKLDGKEVTIDTKNSFTWYDRQMSFGGPRNWTWFEVNFPGSEVKASIWAYDLGLPDNTTYQFATIRLGDSQLVLAYELVPDMSNTWVSPNTHLVYPLSWKLKFDNGDYLTIKSVRPDQEMYGPEELVDSAYTGFITASGKFFGQTHGFGVVELVSVY